MDFCAEIGEIDCFLTHNENTSAAWASYQEEGGGVTALLESEPFISMHSFNPLSLGGHIAPHSGRCVRLDASRVVQTCIGLFLHGSEQAAEMAAAAAAGTSTVGADDAAEMRAPREEWLLQTVVYKLLVDELERWSQHHGGLGSGGRAMKEVGEEPPFTSLQSAIGEPRHLRLQTCLPPLGATLSTVAI